VGEQERSAQAVEGVDEGRLAGGDLEAGFGSGLQSDCRGRGERQETAIPRFGERIGGDIGEDGRVEEGFEVGGCADGGVGQLAGDGSAATNEGSSGKGQSGQQGQAGAGGVVGRRNERGADDGEVAGVETFENAGLLEAAEEAGVEAAALGGFLAGEAEGDGVAGELGGQVLLLREGVAGGVLGLEGDFVVSACTLAEAVDFFLDGVLNAFEVGALFGEAGQFSP
jgi:hypothetical protein